MLILPILYGLAKSTRVTFNKVALNKSVIIIYIHVVENGKKYNFFISHGMTFNDYTEATYKYIFLESSFLQEYRHFEVQLNYSSLK